MMSEDQKKDQPVDDKSKEQDSKPVQTAPPRGRTFGGRGVEKKG